MELVLYDDPIDISAFLNGAKNGLSVLGNKAVLGQDEAGTGLSSFLNNRFLDIATFDFNVGSDLQSDLFKITPNFVSIKNAGTVQDTYYHEIIGRLKLNNDLGSINIGRLANATNKGLGIISIGNEANRDVTNGVYSIAIGEEALKLSDKSLNTVVGHFGFRTLAGGGSSIAIGVGVGSQATYVSTSALMGNNSGYLQPYIESCVFLGDSIGSPDFAWGKSNSNIQYNTATGVLAFSGIGAVVPISQVHNCIYGYSAAALSSSSYINAYGSSAATRMTGNYNDVFGIESLSNGNGAYAGTTLGYRAAQLSTFFQSSVAIGYSNSQNIGTILGHTSTGVSANGGKTSGDLGSYYGYHTGLNNINGDRNCMFGAHIAGTVNNTTSDACHFGTYSGYRQTGANENCAFGNYTLFENLTGIRCTVMGFEAAKNQTASDYVLALGYRAGFNNTQSNRVIIGFNELPVFPNVAAANAALPVPSADGYYLYVLPTGEIMARM